MCKVSKEKFNVKRKDRCMKAIRSPLSQNYVDHFETAVFLRKYRCNNISEVETLAAFYHVLFFVQRFISRDVKMKLYNCMKVYNERYIAHSLHYT